MLNKNKHSIELKFLKSALTEENPFISTESVLKWIKECNNEVEVNIERIKFSDLNQWCYDEDNGNICHETGKFFSIDGMRVKTDWGTIPTWEQPIINQPEIGYLGFITKEINGILYFLVQAKIEPGNVNHLQLSPTLQATKSNYTQVHQGKKPDYLEYFQNRNQSNILLDQLQSEQGARFLQKRNRNIIIQVDDEISVKSNFVWLTLGQLKKLILYDNIVNMDTRTVISGIPFGKYGSEVIDVIDVVSLNTNLSEFGRNILESAIHEDNSCYSFRELIAWLTDLKCRYDLSIKKIPLCDVKDWIIQPDEIVRKDNRFFKIIAAQVTISSREVKSWSQPLVQPAQEGLIAFIIKKINGSYHFLVQAKLECGNFDVLELAPTVQCLTGDYKEPIADSVPFLRYVLDAPKDNIVFDSYQSEEGGRFYKEQNRNIIVMADENFISEFPDNYIWMSLNQMYEFLKFNNYLNIQSRSLISALSFI